MHNLCCSQISESRHCLWSTALIYEYKDTRVLVAALKNTFLSSKWNTQRFINLLSNALSRNSFQPVHAADNVDLQIVQQAINKSKTETVVLVWEDTDLLMLLLHHANRDPGDFFVLWKMGGMKETIKGTMGSWFRHVWQPSVVVAQLSRMFSVGKNQSLKKKKPLESALFRQWADVFTRSGCTHEEVAGGGERAIVCLNGGDENDTLYELQFIKYTEKISTAVKSHPNFLPPASSAAKYHSDRAHL